jgi:hypothetical protein
MTVGPQLSVTEAEAGSGYGGLAAELGRKANWAAATAAAQAGLERLAGPLRAGLQCGKSRPRLLLMLG